jgi:hypothetical protein
MRRDDGGGDEATVAATGGITPDVPVELPAARRQALRSGLRAVEAPAAHRAAFERVAQQRDLATPKPPRADDDPQLAAAVATLRARAAAAAK